MDIRNFFGKAGKAPQTTKAPQDTTSNATTLRASMHRTDGDSDDSPVPAPKPVKEMYGCVDDSLVTHKDSSSREEKKRSPVSAKEVTPSIKRRKDEERVEVSATDFFASQATVKPVPTTTVPNLTEHENQDDAIASTSTVERKRGRSLAIKSDDSGDEEVTIVKHASGEAEALPLKEVARATTEVSPSKRLKKSPLAAEVKSVPVANLEKSEIPLARETPSKYHKEPKKKSSSTKKPRKEPPLEPKELVTSFDSDNAVPQSLEGRTFVFSGVLPNLSRDAAHDFVKILGGRVTTAVSSKTDYLVVGELLEDGRPFSEGSKYRKASELNVIVVEGEKQLFGLAKQYNDKALENVADTMEKKPVPVEASPVPSISKRAASAPPSNPYAKRPSNPYAKAANPYGKPAAVTSASANPYASKNTPISIPSTVSSVKSDPMSLWADRYAPQNTRDILGNQDAVKKLQTWLVSWETKFNNPRAANKSFSSPNGPWKAALISGSPGIGKTTMATLVAKEAGRDLLEFNASDVRSKKAIAQGLGDVTGSQVLNLKAGGGKTGLAKKRCIIMDEVDGMGAGDRSGIAELIKMIKVSKVPIICICNDRQSQKIKSLVQHCLDLRCRRPTKSIIARRALAIGKDEGLAIELNAAEAIVESCGNDIRQVLNCMQMWANKKGAGGSMTYKDVKQREGSINKDEILRVSMFDATKMIVEGRKGLSGADSKAERDSLMRRSDAFFVDYSLMGLTVHQNYLKVMGPQYGEAKRSGDEVKTKEFVDRMHNATFAMSDFAVAEHAVRSGDQNWGLLPLCAILAVKTGYHAGGETGGFFPGFPEFPAWMGKNSTRGKKRRLLQELRHHMNYRVGGDSSELRMCYLPVLRDRFLALLTSKEVASTTEAISLMDEYGLDRDDIFENLDEFKVDPKAEKLASSIDSKQKAAFTREYNKGIHKSQALVAEQGAGKTRKTKSNDSGADDVADLDAINDDMVMDSDDEDDSNMKEAEKIREKFLKKQSKATRARNKKTSGKIKKK